MFGHLYGVLNIYTIYKTKNTAREYIYKMNLLNLINLWLDINY